MTTAKKILGTAFGEEESKLYVDDVFSTYLYTGNGSTQTTNNGIDLAGKGGLVWLKSRSSAQSHILFDTARGYQSYLLSFSSNAAYSPATALSGFTNTGFALGGDSGANLSGESEVAWTFRRAPKFFDIVTYTGNGASGRQIPHGLGVAPGMFMVKAISASSNWVVYHKSLGSTATSYLFLNFAVARGNSGGVIFWGGEPTDTHIRLDNDTIFGTGTNINGVQYVAYLWAHDPSEDGIVQCGSYTGNGSATGPIVSLGWEPQYLMIKNASGTGNWQIIDNMRGMPVGSADATLQANLSNAESSVDYISPTATGFQVTSTSSEVNTNGNTYIYMAIRRPNKPPKTGTEVYKGIARAGLNANAGVITGIGFSPDLLLTKARISSMDYGVFTRVLGNSRGLATNLVIAEFGSASQLRLDFDMSNSVGVGADQYGLVNGGYTYMHNFFRRAPGFFDVVCYTGNSVEGRLIPHSLGVSPRMIIVKRLNSAGYWSVYHMSGGNQFELNSSAASGMSGYQNGNSAAHDKNAFRVGTGTVDNVAVNNMGSTYVAYLFASLPGISKVGGYTGNGSSQIISCGFSTGARFILIKRRDAAGDWYVWDSARGIVAANDPHLSLNTIAAEVTTDDSVDPEATGFIVNQNTATNINVSGGQYIFLSVA